MPAPAGGRLGQLSDLRAFAAGLVVMCHTGLVLLALHATPQSPALYWVGRVGVAVFFMISGYVIYRPFTADRPDLWRYAVRRVARIVPAYWLALAWLLWIVPSMSSSPVDELHFFGFAQIYSTNTFVSGLGPAWTLCVEMTFYAAAPAFAALMRLLGRRRRRLEPWAIATLAVVSVAARIASPHGLIGASLIGYAGWFVPGMLLAVLPRKRWPVSAERGNQPVTFVASAIALTLVAAHLSFTCVERPLMRRAAALRARGATVRDVRQAAAEARRLADIAGVRA